MSDTEYKRNYQDDPEAIIKYRALELAIKAGSGTEYNNDAFAIVNSDKIVEAAKKFEIYMKG